MSEWVSVVGTLLGTVVGSSATLVMQRSQAKSRAEERVYDSRRAAYGEFMAGTHGLFLQIRERRLAVAGAGEGADLEKSLRQIQPLESQRRLDELRLLATTHTRTAAEELFQFLRRVDAKAIRSGKNWHEWHMQYRALRRTFIRAAQIDLGVADSVDQTYPGDVGADGAT